MNFQFIEKFRHSSKHEDMENEEEESPTELNTINSSGGFMIVSPDKLSIKYTGFGQHGHDVGVVQSNKPAPFKRHTYYCEIYVKDAGVKGRVSIGFTTDNFKTGRHPGVEYERNRDVGSQIRKLESSISFLETDLIKIQKRKSELKEITEKAANKINNWQNEMGVGKEIVDLYLDPVRKLADNCTGLPRILGV